MGATVYTPPYQTIGDRKINVAMKLGNRADLLEPADPSFAYSRISGWLRDAYIATSTCRQFEQTEETFEFVTAMGQSSYPIPSEMRAKISLTGFDSNYTPIQMDEKDIAYIRKYSATTPPSNTTGTRPSLYCFYRGNIHFRPVPGGQYNMILDYWARPEIDEDDLDDTELLLPDEWLEIVDYEAAVRGNAELLQEDKSRNIQELIYGFVDPQSQHYVPGLIERLQNRAQAGAPYKDYGMQPQYREGYTK